MSDLKSMEGHKNFQSTNWWGGLKSDSHEHILKNRPVLLQSEILRTQRFGKSNPLIILSMTTSSIADAATIVNS